jgi:hypothetical protein
VNLFFEVIMYTKGIVLLLLVGFMLLGAAAEAAMKAINAEIISCPG